MSSRAEHDEGRDAVAWLLVGPAAGEAGATPPRVVPISREGCLAVADAVLSAAAATAGVVDGAAVAGPTLADRLTAVAARVPAVAAWLQSSLPNDIGGQGDAAVLSRFAAALMLRSTEAAGPAPATEAAVLRSAVQVAESQARWRERFDEAVAQARLEAMRELAYGAGHEINNPLANIATRAQALLLDEADPERRRRLSTIVDQSFRARDMIGGLMLFARPPKARRQSVDAGGIAAAAIEAVRGQAAARGVRLEYSPLPSPVAVFVDRAQVEEALRVVVVNALEAVAQGGRVVLGVTRPSGDAGGWCEITVADDGRGMSLDAVKRAFDPFYSGREAGRGAGLGLPKAWRLVESSGGRLMLDSRSGHGTRVTLQLPEAAAENAELAGPKH